MRVVVRPLVVLGIQYFKRQYENASSQMDKIMVNSEHVQRRLHYYLGLTFEMVYPPIVAEGGATRNYCG